MRVIYGYLGYIKKKYFKKICFFIEIKTFRSYESFKHVDVLLIIYTRMENEHKFLYYYLL